MRTHGRAREFEFRLRRKDGSIAETLMSSEIIELRGESCMLAVTSDVNDRKRAELQLRESERRFADVVEAAGEYVWESDRQRRYLYVSSRIEKVLGYPVDEVLGRSAYDFMPPEEAARVRAWFDLRGDTAEPIRNLEHVSITRDGRRIWQRVSGVPFYATDGSRIGFRGTGPPARTRSRRRGGAEHHPGAGQAVRRRRPQPRQLGHRRHQRLPQRRRRRRHPDPQCRYGHVLRQGTPPPELPVFLAADECARRRKTEYGKHPQARHRERGIRTLLPSQVQPRRRAPHRGRGAAALPSSAAGSDLAGAIHSDRRGNRVDRPARRVGAAAGLRAGARLARFYPAAQPPPQPRAAVAGDQSLGGPAQPRPRAQRS